MIEWRHLWRLPLTAVFGAMLGGMILAVAGWLVEFARAPSLLDFFTAFAMVPVLLFAAGLGLFATKWTLVGTALLFWPLCRAFPARTRLSLAIFAAVGAAAGAGLGLVIDDWPSLESGGTADPDLLTRLACGIAFGASTAAVGWGLLPDRDDQDEA